MRGQVITLVVSFVGLILLGWFAAETVAPKYGERSDGLAQINLEHKRRSVIANFPGVDPSWKKQIPQLLAPPIAISPPGGRVAPQTIVSLSTTSGARLRYTLDGSIPDRHSPLYADPIRIDSTVVVRARSFVNGKFPGDIQTQTYIVNSRHTLSVVAISTDPENLWNKYSGIYEKWDQKGKRSHRKAYLEYLSADGRSSISGVVDFRIHGGWSRRLPKKAFHLYFDRDALSGDATSDHLIADGTGGRRELVVRAGGHMPNVRLNDVIFQDVFGALGYPIGSIEPIALYLNGQYFGAYNLREPVDADFVRRHYGIENPDLIEIDNCWLGDFTYFYPCYYPVAGDDDDWSELIRFFNDADLTDATAYARAAQWIDLEELVDYWILNVFLGNMDWPESNGYVMRNRDGDDRRWRWVPWDADQVLASGKNSGADRNTLARTTTIPEPPPKPWIPMDGFVATDIHSSNWKGTLIITKLLMNQGFRESFITRYTDLLNTEFSVANMNPRLTKWADLFSSEVGRDLETWKMPAGYFDERLQLARDFLEERPRYAFQHLQDRFELNDPIPLTISTNDASGGTIRLNSAGFSELPFAGRYFPESRLVVTAVPNDGFEFVRWSSGTTASLGTNETIRLQAGQVSNLVAEFRLNRVD